LREPVVLIFFRSNVGTVDSSIKKRASGDPSSGDGPDYLSVTQVARLFNDILETSFPQLLFKGEISQLTVAQSGHLYFTVKDEGAQVSCVMWAGTARTLRFKPAAGMAVRCHGRPNVYPQTGRLQVVVSRMTEDGEGDLQRKFLELKARLERDGFFAPERKRPLPFMPRAVGIVTSKTGAVIHDMMVKIRERFPSMVVYLSETRVQGEGAAAEISEALRKLDASDLVDVIIVARGGGSLEDLWAFNEEEVVKAVFACRTPVISGVGHEVDTTLCDFAADVRAPTPTAAAEMAVPKVSDLLVRVAELERRLRDSDRWLQPRAQRVDELAGRLSARVGGVLAEARLHVKSAESSLVRIRPDRVIEMVSAKVQGLRDRLLQAGRSSAQLNARGVDTLATRLSSASRRRVETLAATIGHLGLRLESLSPQRVLERGYSIVSTEGRHVRSIGDVAVGAPLEVAVADGVISGKVQEISKESKWQKQ
jgi:exodeoxyribonuclease VII large subunit